MRLDNGRVLCRALFEGWENRRQLATCIQRMCILPIHPNPTSPISASSPRAAGSPWAGRSRCAQSRRPTAGTAERQGVCILRTTDRIDMNYPLVKLDAAARGREVPRPSAGASHGTPFHMVPGPHACHRTPAGQACLPLCELTIPLALSFSMCLNSSGKVNSELYSAPAGRARVERDGGSAWGCAPSASRGGHACKQNVRQPCRPQAKARMHCSDRT